MNAISIVSKSESGREVKILENKLKELQKQQKKKWREDKQKKEITKTGLQEELKKKLLL